MKHLFSRTVGNTLPLVALLGASSVQAAITLPFSIDFGGTAEGSSVAGPLETDTFTSAGAGDGTIDGLDFVYRRGSSTAATLISATGTNTDSIAVSVPTSLLPASIGGDRIRHNSSDRVSGFTLEFDADEYGTYSVALMMGFEDQNDINGSTDRVYMGVASGAAGSTAADNFADMAQQISASYGDYSSTITEWNPQTGDAAWNYLTGTFTIDADNPYLFVFAEGVGGAKTGFTALQIVPEPSTFGIYAGVIVFGLVMLRRRLR